MIGSTRSWLLTTIQSPFNHIFWYWWRHLMPSQVCSMTHLCLSNLLVKRIDLKLCVSQNIKTMLCLVIYWVYKMFDWFAGDGICCSSALCLFTLCTVFLRINILRLFSLIKSFLRLNIFFRLSESTAGRWQSVSNCDWCHWWHW